jgi:hypothetical protein
MNTFTASPLHGNRTDTSRRLGLFSYSEHPKADVRFWG